MKGPTSDEKRLVLFENPWLEKLTVTHVGFFAAIWALLIPSIAFAGWEKVSLTAAFGMMFCGVLVWSLFEYVAHRYLFHWNPRWSPARRILFAVHGNHHIQPTDRLRNLMPPIVSVPTGAVIWGIFYLVLQDAGTWLFLGFIVGYVTYDLTHYACHQWPMRGPLAKIVKQHHMRHHFKTDSANFGVTTPFWDRVFNTRMPSSRRKASSEDMGDRVPHPAE